MMDVQSAEVSTSLSEDRPASTRILITGGTGQVGTELARLEWPEGVVPVMPTREELDLSDAEAVGAFVAQGAFAAVINPAAYTAVDKAESDIVAAFKVNALAPAALAAATGAAGIPLIHVSTDYVFDGRKDGPYVEDDAVGPQGVYGASKEAGEQAVRTGNPRHAIVRTAWVFSPHGNNFVKTMLRLGAERPALRVVADQIGSPTAAADIAGALSTIALRMIAEPGAPSGTWHFVNDGEASWHDLAAEIFRLEAENGRAVIPQIEAITTADYPTPARRPANSRLSTLKLRADHAITPRPWRNALADTLAMLRNSQAKDQIR